MNKNKVTLKKLGELLINPPDNLLVEVYDENKKGPTHHSGGNIVKKPTLNQRMDRIETRMNQLETSIVNLVKEMRAGFKQINYRLDNVETRLDKVEKRLDYNNLKRLPN